MLSDGALYRSKGWTVSDTLFPGGHTLAPAAVYNDVFAHLTTQPGW